MQDVTKLAELTEAQNAVRVLTDRLNQANSYLSRYAVQFETTVDSETLDIELKVKKPFNSGSPGAKQAGFIKTIPKDVALYYKSDVSTLAEAICEEVFEILLKSEIKRDLLQDLTRAVVNVAIMESKK
jgi:hypothetical protein